MLVASSDHGRDVFETVFQNAETMWCDCEWPRFVGFTSPHPDIYGFKALAAKKPSDWRRELLDQLDSLPNEIGYVLLLLEDAFFLSPVDTAQLNAIANLMVQDGLSYVSMLPLRRNIFGLMVEYFRKKLSNYPLRRLSRAEPYYSSIGITLWSRSYLRWFLQQPGSIWDLEHIVSDQPHHAVWAPVFKQDHLVTKGKWSSRARSLLASQGISLSTSKRGFRPVSSRVRDIREMFIFQTIGFLSFRVRRRLKRISHRAPLEDSYKLALKDRQ